MTEIKDKVVTVESLSVLHEHNKKSYMPMVDPEGVGTMCGVRQLTDGKKLWNK